MVRPKKHLGQHFLHDQNIAEKITQCLKLSIPTIVEVGPGTGVLTQFLIQNPTIRDLLLIEIDAESVQYLENLIKDPKVQLHQADFLQSALDSLVNEPFAIIGNFPYNISSQIFFRVLEYRNQIPEVVGMIQKEVAERIAAPPGNKQYGILSVLLQTWYDIDYCFTVHEHVFTPPPKVKSGVIRLVRNQTQTISCDEKLYIRVIKTAFNQRRKTLRNALRPILLVQDHDHNLLTKRAEQLSIDQFIELTSWIENRLKSH